MILITILTQSLQLFLILKSFLKVAPRISPLDRQRQKNSKMEVSLGHIKESPVLGGYGYRPRVKWKIEAVVQIIQAKRRSNKIK